MMVQWEGIRKICAAEIEEPDSKIKKTKRIEIVNAIHGVQGATGAIIRGWGKTTAHERRCKEGVMRNREKMRLIIRTWAVWKNERLSGDPAGRYH